MVAGVFFVDDSLKPITVGHFKSNENTSKKQEQNCLHSAIIQIDRRIFLKFD